MLCHRSTTPGETKLLASEVYELLQASSGPESDRAEGAPSGRRKAQFFLGSTNKRAKTVVLHIDGLDDSVSGPTVKTTTHVHKACKHKGGWCVCFHKCPSHSILSSCSQQSRRTLCEEALLKIRGVISFTFQMAVKRCIVRIRSDLKAEVRLFLSGHLMQPIPNSDMHHLIPY